MAKQQLVVCFPKDPRCIRIEDKRCEAELTSLDKLFRGKETTMSLVDVRLIDEILPPSLGNLVLDYLDDELYQLVSFFDGISAESGVKCESWFNRLLDSNDRNLIINSNDETVWCANSYF